MAERFFTKVANDVLEASEQLSNRLEEGIATILNGDLAPKQHAQEDQQQQQQGPPHDDQFEIDEEELRHNPLQGMAESLVGDIMSGQTYGPQTPREHFDAFRQAIRWTEPFILALAAFQLVMFLLCLWASRRNVGLAPRVVLMLLIAGLVRCAEYINSLASQHWESFATQNYFDERGIFVAIMFCTPLLLDSLIMLLMFLREAGQLLVQVKTAEFKKRGRQAKEEGKSEPKEEGKNGSKEEGKNGSKKRRSKKQQ